MAEQRKCRRCSGEFSIHEDDHEFYRDISPQFAGETFLVPLPSLCPDCRLQRRFLFRNERCLYRSKSCLSGESLIGMFAPQSPLKVCTYEEWWGDSWDPMDYGREYNPSIPFFDQLLELARQVPHCPLYIRNGQNSDYTNFCLNLKDCYLVFGTTDCELCLYAKSLAFCREVLDSIAVVKSELCYEGLSSERCYHCSFFSDCTECTNCFMIEACESCSNCALCYGLHRKEYYVFNEYVGRERFEQFMESLKPLTWARIGELRDQLDTLASSAPHRAGYIVQSQNCDGNNILQSKNCFWCFDIRDCEDCKYLFWTPKGIRSYDCSYNSPDGVELCYEVCSTLGTRTMGTFMCWNNDRCYYSMECHYNHDIMGCIGLRHKQHCILNKQYSPEQYGKVAKDIVQSLQKSGQWGEYVPEKLSYFGYNETIAQEYFPLSPQEAHALGFMWNHTDRTQPTQAATSEIPETIEEVTAQVLDQTFQCAQTRKPYRIMKSELEVHQKLGIPLSRLCPDERHRIRLSRRPPLSLWQRACAQTGEMLWTSYPPTATWPILCGDAYRKQFYG